jgi:protein-L-isoaspartate(D-aspartate) O-methyltransferase
MSTFDAEELTIVRRAYARQMLAIAGVAANSDLEHAFATVPREQFLGSPPWRFARAAGYEVLPSVEPVLVYQDILLALAPERSVNNGSPSLHARWLDVVRPRPGERIVHVGAGAGYYTAIMAELIGASGHVSAVEFDADLAARAKTSLADYANVSVLCDDGALYPEQEADIVYVNFAVERPIRRWTDQLSLGGRLIFPLGVAPPRKDPKASRTTSYGAALLITRQENGLAVTWLHPAWFVCAEGQANASDAERETLNAAFQRGGIEFVKSLRWDDAMAPERVWCSGDGWRLSYDPPGL